MCQAVPENQYFESVADAIKLLLTELWISRLCKYLQLIDQHRFNPWKSDLPGTHSVQSRFIKWVFILQKELLTNIKFWDFSSNSFNSHWIQNILQTKNKLKRYIMNHSQVFTNFLLIYQNLSKILVFVAKQKVSSENSELIKTAINLLRYVLTFNEHFN